MRSSHAPHEACELKYLPMIGVENEKLVTLPMERVSWNGEVAVLDKQYIVMLLVESVMYYLLLWHMKIWQAINPIKDKNCVSMTFYEWGIYTEQGIRILHRANEE